MLDNHDFLGPLCVLSLYLLGRQAQPEVLMDISRQHLTVTALISLSSMFVGSAHLAPSSLQGLVQYVSSKKYIVHMQNTLI